MPDSAKHLTFSKQAFDEAESMHKTTRWRWASVAYFYAGMHAIHAALADMDNIPSGMRHPDSHAGNDGTMTVVRKHLAGVFLPYSSLFSTSVDVRYNGTEVAKSLIDQHRSKDLPPIGSEVCGILHEPDCSCWLRSL